jgi:nitrate/nitrite-specific signal transduction histidine kinase
LLAELRPSVLTDSSLGDLLRQLANAFTGRTNITVGMNIAGEHVLSAELQVALYRICQEALNNIAKHAGASQVDIDLHESVAVFIASTTHDARRDRGPLGGMRIAWWRGYDAAGRASSHYGLAMMLSGPKRRRSAGVVNRPGRRRSSCAGNPTNRGP